MEETAIALLLLYIIQPAACKNNLKKWNPERKHRLEQSLDVSEISLDTDISINGWAPI